MGWADLWEAPNVYSKDRELHRHDERYSYIFHAFSLTLRLRCCVCVFLLVLKARWGRRRIMFADTRDQACGRLGCSLLPTVACVCHQSIHPLCTAVGIYCSSSCRDFDRKRHAVMVSTHITIPSNLRTTAMDTLVFRSRYATVTQKLARVRKREAFDIIMECIVSPRGPPGGINFF
jgi:hypothetical protein